MNYQAFTNDTLTMMYEGARGALAVDDELKKLGNEPTRPSPHLGLDRIKPVVEKVNSHLGCRLQGIRLRGNVRHGVVSSPTLQRRMIRG